jgi:hypothetical protein
MLWLTAAAVGAGPLSQGERDRAMSSLHASRKMLLDELANVSDAQWRFKPAPERWSVAECAEHIALSEDRIFQLVMEKILKSPAAPDKSTDEQKAKDAKVLELIANRSRKGQAPEFLKPAGKWKSRNELIEHFKQSRDRTIAYIEKTDASLRDHFAPHPAMEVLDAYQWILLISAHSERHTRQIREVEADPNFPAE